MVLDVPKSPESQRIQAETIQHPALREARLQHWMKQLLEMHGDRRESLEIEMRAGIQQKFDGIDAKNSIAEREILDNIIAQNLTTDEICQVLRDVSHPLFAEIFKIFVKCVQSETSERRNESIRRGKAAIDSRVHMDQRRVGVLQSLLDSLLVESPK